MSRKEPTAARTLEEVCVSRDLRISEAVKVLNDGHRRIVLVVDGWKTLLGVVADSDVRQAIIKRVSFDLPVARIMVKKPIVATLDMSDREVVSLMQATRCYEIPVVDRDRRVVGLRGLDSFIGQKLTAEVVIMAGGLGERLRPLTTRLPKPLIKIGDRAMLLVLIERLMEAGFSRITLALNYKADMIRKAVEAEQKFAAVVKFVVEEKKMGTAGALSLLNPRPDEAFLVVNADILTAVDYGAMLRFHHSERNEITMAVVEEKHQLAYGIVRMRGARVLEIAEKPVHRYFLNAGIYILAPEVVEHVLRDRPSDMPDLINATIGRHRRVGSFPVHEYWLDVGIHDQLCKARRDVSLSSGHIA